MRWLHQLLTGASVIFLLPCVSLGADPQQTADEALLRQGHIGLADDDLLAFLRGHGLTVPERARVSKLVEQLGDSRFAIRTQATRQLQNASPGALAMLRATLQDPDPERRRRAQLCIGVLEARTSPTPLEAALRLIKLRKVTGANAVVHDVLVDAADSGVRDEARSTLLALEGGSTPDCSPTVRARKAAARFLGALAQGNWQSFRKITDVPFALGGNLSLSSWAEFDDLFRPVLLERKHPNKNMVFSLAHVIRAENYPAEGFEKEFLAAFPVNELRAVYATARVDDGREENGAVFVRLDAAGWAIIGFGQHGPSPGTRAP